jgi:hypothetical protein
MESGRVIRPNPGGGFDLHLEDDSLVRQVAIALRVMNQATTPGSRIEGLSTQVDDDIDAGVLVYHSVVSGAFWSTDGLVAGRSALTNIKDEERRIVEDALLAYTAVLPQGHVDQTSLRALRTSLKETP